MREYRWGWSAWKGQIPLNRIVTQGAALWHSSEKTADLKWPTKIESGRRYVPALVTAAESMTNCVLSDSGTFYFTRPSGLVASDLTIATSAFTLLSQSVRAQVVVFRRTVRWLSLSLVRLSYLKGRWPMTNEWLQRGEFSASKIKGPCVYN